VIWDGQALATFTNVPLAHDSLALAHFGASASWGRSPWVGKLDEIAIYSSALSTSAIQSHVRAAFGLGNNPVINTATSANNVVLSWVDPGNWVLESASTLPASSWTPVQTNGSPAVVQANGNKFFRLRAQ